MLDIIRLLEAYLVQCNIGASTRRFRMSSYVSVAEEGATVRSRLTQARTKLQKSVDVSCVSALEIDDVARSIGPAPLCVHNVLGIAMATSSR